MNVDYQVLRFDNKIKPKKIGGLGFTYDSASELNFLYFNPGELQENEYYINEKGLFIPGITEKKDKEKILLPKKCQMKDNQY